MERWRVCCHSPTQPNIIWSDMVVPNFVLGWKPYIFDTLGPCKISEPLEPTSGRKLARWERRGEREWEKNVINSLPSMKCIPIIHDLNVFATKNAKYDHMDMDLIYISLQERIFKNVLIVRERYMLIKKSHICSYQKYFLPLVLTFRQH